MEKLQKHLDAQAKEAVAQATEKMLKNKTARDIVAEKVAANPKALEAALQTKESVAQATEKMLKSKTGRNIVAEKVAANPRALEVALQNALASGKLAEFLTTLSSEQKKQIRRMLG